VAQFLSQSNSLPYRFLPDIPRARVEGFVLESLTARLTAPKSGVLAGRLGEVLTGIVAYEPLPWESNILGRKAASLSPILGSTASGLTDTSLGKIIAKAINCIRADGGELITTKTYTTDMLAIHALETQGFQLMDTVVEPTFRLPGISMPVSGPCPAGFSIRFANKSDIADLRSVSAAAFSRHFGRFHADPRIGPETATRLYEDWIQACVEGWADWTLLAEHQGRIAGFGVWKKPSAAEFRYHLSVGNYNFGAIHPDYQRLGLFKYLTSEGMRLLQGEADYIVGPTHVHNLPIQRGLLKLGWQISDSRHSFHKWLN